MAGRCLSSLGKALEKNAKKTRFAILSAIFMLSFTSIGAVYFHLYLNAQRINEALCAEDPTLCSMVDNNLFNVGFLLWGEWTD